MARTRELVEAQVHEAQPRRVANVARNRAREVVGRQVQGLQITRQAERRGDGSAQLVAPHAEVLQRGGVVEDVGDGAHDAVVGCARNGTAKGLGKISDLGSKSVQGYWKRRGHGVVGCVGTLLVIASHCDRLRQGAGECCLAMYHTPVVFCGAYFPFCE